MTAFAMAMLVCSDLARSRAFYRDVLSLRIGTDASPDWVDFELGDGQRLGLHPDSETLMVRPGSLQLGFNVDNVDAFITDARMAGVRDACKTPTIRVFGRVAVITDPGRVRDPGVLAQTCRCRAPLSARPLCGNSSTRRTTAITSSTTRSSRTPTTTRCCAS